MLSIQKVLTVNKIHGVKPALFFWSNIKNEHKYQLTNIYFVIIFLSNQVLGVPEC